MGQPVTINDGFTNVWLTDRQVYQAGETAILTDAQYTLLLESTSAEFIEAVLDVSASPVPDPEPTSPYEPAGTISEAAAQILDLDGRVTTIEGIVL
jgi:hypothetical protein